MQLRRSRRRFAAWLALCAYLVVGAIVPPGHMAAALASGTAFHLCPGDLRSAQILRALAETPADAPADAMAGARATPAQAFPDRDDGVPAGADVPFSLLLPAQPLTAAYSPATGHHPSGHDTPHDTSQTHHDRGAAPPQGAHPATHAADAGNDPGEHGLHGVLVEALDNDAADAGCTLASGAGAAVDALPPEPDEPRQAASLFPTSRRVSAVAARWLRPPVRSPPL
jgi:hypothetical protein